MAAPVPSAADSALKVSELTFGVPLVATVKNIGQYGTRQLQRIPKNDITHGVALSVLVAITSGPDGASRTLGRAYGLPSAAMGVPLRPSVMGGC